MDVVESFSNDEVIACNDADESCQEYRVTPAY